TAGESSRKNGSRLPFATPASLESADLSQTFGFDSGRPCGQWCESWAGWEAISPWVSRSPARTAAWQAIRLGKSFKGSGGQALAYNGFSNPARSTKPGKRDRWFYPLTNAKSLLQDLTEVRAGPQHGNRGGLCCSCSTETGSEGGASGIWM